MYTRLFFSSFIIILALTGLPMSQASGSPTAALFTVPPQAAPYIPQPLLPDEPSAGPSADGPVSIQAENPVLIWNTFHGTTAGSVEAQAVAIDGDGNIYIAGNSTATWGLPVHLYSADWDVFVAKLNNTGVLQWNTFMGGNGIDKAHDIKLDQSGNIYVTGESWGDNWGDPLNDHAGNADAFVAKLDNDGNRLWHTFLGCNTTDRGYGIDVAANGAIYLVGTSGGPWGGVKTIEPFKGESDAFVAKLDDEGELQWNTFVGSAAGNDDGYAVTVHSSGIVFVTGKSALTWGDNPVRIHSGDEFDAFVVQFNGDTGARGLHTFMGNYGGKKSGEGITLNETAGRVYVGGADNQRVYGADQVWVGEFVTSTLTLQDRSVIGHSGEHNLFGGINVDAAGHVYVVGSSKDWGTPLHPHSGSADLDVFVAQFDSALDLDWHTFLGSPSSDYGYDVAMSEDGAIYVVGSSDATWGSPINPFTTGTAAFVAEIKDPIPLSNVTIAGPTVGLTDTLYSFIVSTSPETATMPVTYVWQVTDQGTITHTGELTDSVSFSWTITGDKDIRVAATNAAGTISDSHIIFITDTIEYKSYIPIVRWDFFCDQYEPNDSRPKNGGWPPGPLIPGQTIEALICPGDPRDLYYVDLTFGETATFILTGVPPAANFDLYLWDENSDTPKAESKNGPGKSETITYAAPVTGRYYVDVYPSQGTGAYSLRYQ